MSVENWIVIESWRWPQWFIVVTAILSLYCDLSNPQKEDYEYHFSTATFIAARIFMNFVFFCGGFYSVFDIPQILMIALSGLGVLLYMIDSVDCPTYVVTDKVVNVFNVCFIILLLAMGGFFA